MNLDDTLSPLELAARLSDAMSQVGNSSLPEYNSSTRLTPLVLIDKSVMVTDQGLMAALMQTLLSLYSAQYLTGVNLAMTVGDVQVRRLLTQFGTDKSLFDSIGTSRWWANEEVTSETLEMPIFGLEADESRLKINSKSDLDKTIGVINDASNLAVGKIIELKLISGANVFPISVTATLVPKVISPKDLVSISANNNIDESWTGRTKGMLRGNLRPVRDYLLNFDLIESKKQNLLSDDTGVLLSARLKRTKGILAALASGHASPNDISTMVIVSKNTAEEMEVALRGSFDKRKIRDKFFNHNVAMMLVVVDTMMESFTIYYRGINEAGEYTLEDIKNNDKKSNGLDMGSVVEAFKLGDRPSL